MKPVDSTHPPETAGEPTATERYLRSDFLLALVHAMRSPLSVAQGAVVELTSSNDVDRELMAAMATRNLQRLTLLAEKLERVAELESGILRPQMRNSELCRELNQAQAQWKPGALQVEVRQPSPSYPIECDSRLLHWSLVAILENAAKHAKARVRLSIESLPNAVALHIEDDGAGLQPNQYSEMFDRWRSARARGASSDLGLSLSIARDYTTLQSGQLTLGPSTELGGLRCTLSFPIKN